MQIKMGIFYIIMISITIFVIAILCGCQTDGKNNGQFAIEKQKPARKIVVL